MKSLFHGLKSEFVVRRWLYPQLWEGNRKPLRAPKAPVQSHLSTACHALRSLNHSHHKDMDLKSNTRGKQDTNAAHEMSSMPINIYFSLELYGIWVSQLSCGKK